MNERDFELDRRTAIRGVGALGTAAIMGGAGIFASSQGARAAAGGSIDDPDTATSDDGRIRWVAVQTTGRMTWDGFDDPVKHFRILVSVELRRGGSTLWEGEIHDTGVVDATQGSDWGSAGDEVALQGDYGEGRAGYIASDADWGIIQRNRDHIYNDGYGLPENPAPAHYLYSNDDGTTTDTRVVLKAEYQLYDEDQAYLTNQPGYPDHPTFETDFVVSVENEESTIGSGDEDAEGDTEDSAEVGV